MQEKYAQKSLGLKKGIKSHSNNQSSDRNYFDQSDRANDYNGNRQNDNHQQQRQLSVYDGNDLSNTYDSESSSIRGSNSDVRRAPPARAAQLNGHNRSSLEAINENDNEYALSPSQHHNRQVCFMTLFYVL